MEAVLHSPEGSTGGASPGSVHAAHSQGNTVDVVAQAAQGWGSLYLVLAVASSKALAMYPVHSLKCGTWPRGELRTCRHVSGPALPSPPRTEPAGQLALSLLHLEATKEASN